MRSGALQMQRLNIAGLYAVLFAGAALAIAFSPLAALALVAIALFLAFLARPKLSLYAAIFLFPLIHYKPFAGVKPAELFLLTLLASALLLVLTDRLKVRVTRPIACLLIFIVISIASFINQIGLKKDSVIFISGIYSPNINSINMVLRYVVVALILLVVPLAIQSERDLRKAIRIHIISGTLVSVFGFMLVGLFILGKPVSLPICRSFGGYAGMWGVRLAGTAYEPAGFANYLLSVIPITFAVWINERKPGKELLLFAAFVIQSSAMLFTLSSGGWLALVLILPLLLLRLWKKMNRTKKMGLLVLALLPLVLLSQLASSGVVPTHRAAFVLIGKFTIDTAGRSDRVETAKILLRMISDYPLLGIGPGNFAYKVGSYTHKGAGLTDATKLAVYPASWRANNDYLTIPAETGIPAFLVFMLFIGALLKYHFGVLKSVRGTADEAIIVGMVFAVIALLLQAFAAFSILNPFIWVLSALIYGYHRSVTVARDEARL